MTLSLFDKVMARVVDEWRQAVAQRWPDIDATTLDDLQVAKLYNEITREREAAIAAMGRRP